MYKGHDTVVTLLWGDRGVISELGELNGIQVQLYEMDVALILLSLLRISGMLERVVASGNAYSGPHTDRGNDRSLIERGQRYTN